MESSSHKDTVKVVELCRVSPPPASVAQTSLPLTFFDLLWIPRPPSECLYFYNLPTSNTHFTHSLLPQLKHSLSLTLQHFYPLSGKLIWSPEFDKPVIRYVEGDSVSVTVAESDSDFNHLLSNHVRNANESHPLVPPLLVSGALVPVMTVQLTLFPNSGISVGITTHHAVCDGRTAIEFMKSWASVCRLGDTPLLTESLPFYDRTVITDPGEIEKIYLKELINCKFIHSESESKSNPTYRNFKVLDVRKQPNAVRATFELGRADLARLRQSVLARRKKDGEETPTFYISTFVLTCAYTWVCLAKAGQDGSRDNKVYIRFTVDCRARLDPPIPATYFGNCVRRCTANAERSDIMGEDGIAFAVDAIREAIKGLDNGVLRGAEGWLSGLFSSDARGLVTVTGLTRFGSNEADFGWGRPKMVEMTSIYKTGAISLMNSSNGDGGVEISLVRNRNEMDAFASTFVNSLNAL